MTIRRGNSLPLASAGSQLSRRAEHGKIRVALVNPPQSYPVELAAEYQSYFPVGVAMLGAVLEMIGIDVRLIDCLAHDQSREEGGLVHFGLSPSGLREKLQRFAPHIVGIANPFSMFVDDAIRVAELVKGLNRETQVVVGGIEASIAPNNRMLLSRCPDIDVLVVGEGELTMVDLASRFSLADRTFSGLSDVAGILFRDPSGHVQSTGERPWIEDLDSLPFPAYHLLDLDLMYGNPRYAIHRDRVSDRRCIPMHTSRGCPYKCNFCSVHSQVGRTSRRHSPAYVVRHIEHVRDRYGITHVHFEDDNLTIHPAHTAALLSAIEPLGITFDTPNGIRADTVDETLARQLRASGALSVTMAAESGNQRVLDEVVEKALDLQAVTEAARHLRNAGLLCYVFFIIGFPEETEREVRDTLRFAKRLTQEFGTINFLFVANPLPGTPLHQECVERGYLVAPLDKRSLFTGIRLNGPPLVETPEFRKSDLLRWSRDELAVDGIVTTGSSMPMFLADNERGWDTAKRLMRSCGLTPPEILPPGFFGAPFPWDGPQSTRS
jgi:magnesium-protoporphyrin IX monomethyl ester (oxidative) cyclase